MVYLRGNFRILGSMMVFQTGIRKTAALAKFLGGAILLMKSMTLSIFVVWLFNKKHDTRIF